MKRVLLVLLLMFMPLQLLALDVPRLSGRVNDLAGMLSPEAAARLEQQLAAFERQDSTQIVVLTIPSLEGDDIDQFAIRVAEQWKIGQAGKDNGVLLILAKAERRVRIEVGRGLQGVLPDVTASRIIRDVMRPHLKNNDFDRGISSGAEAIIAATKGEFKAAPGETAKKPHNKSVSPLTIMLLALVGALILGTFSRYLGGLAGAIGLPLASWLVFPGIGLITLALLAVAGLLAGWMIGGLLSGGSWGGGGGFFGGGGWGGGFYGGGFGGGSSGGDSGGFSGGGGEFDGGGSSDDY